MKNLKQYQSNQLAWEPRITYTHKIHVWNISQHLPHKWSSFVGKYTSTMDPMGYTIYIYIQFLTTCDFSGIIEPVSQRARARVGWGRWGPRNLMEAVGTAQSFDLGLPGRASMGDVYEGAHTDYMGVSENSVPLNPMVNDHYPY